VKLCVLPSLRAAADTARRGRRLSIRTRRAALGVQVISEDDFRRHPGGLDRITCLVLIMQGTADLISMQFPRSPAFIPRAQFRWLHGFSRDALHDNVRARSVLCRQRDSTTPVPEAASAPGTGVLGVGRGQACYLLSASTRRSMSSSTLPDLGSCRLASWSLSSALVKPS
jgi:hypothetical protein